jgi:aminoglycoside 3-N-acetyltransferase
MSITYDVLHTRSSLAQQFEQVGLQAGMHVMVHSSFKAIGGWVVGGAETVIHALMDVITRDGTLIMPTHTNNNTDPQYWENPPVPSEWWQSIRDETPPYNPLTSITSQMGTIAENFRRFPLVFRSSHPMGSFATWGKHAEWLTESQPLDAMFGEESPLARLYQLGGHIFLLGVGHENNTSLHLAEHRAKITPRIIDEGSAMWIDGQRQWVTYRMLDYDDDDFGKLGDAYESQHHPHIIGKVGNATTRLLPMRPLLDYAVWWLEQNRR